MPVRSGAMLAPGLPSRAILASRFLATRTDPPASRMRARRSCIWATVMPS
jgi:hypothetical protein